MCRLRTLALSAGFLLCLTVVGCGMNPQPEPPSVDDTTADSGAGGATDWDPIGRPDQPDAGDQSKTSTTPPSEPDAGTGETEGQHYSRGDDPNNGFADPGANDSQNGAATPTPQPEDAGVPNRDAGAPPPPPPREDSGVLAM